MRRLAANFPDDLTGEEGEPLSLEDATKMIREQWGLGEFAAQPKATDEPKSGQDAGSITAK